MNWYGHEVQMHAKAVPSSTFQLEQAGTGEEPGEVLLTSYQWNSKGDTPENYDTEDNSYEGNLCSYIQ